MICGPPLFCAAFTSLLDVEYVLQGLLGGVVAAHAMNAAAGWSGG